MKYFAIVVFRCLLLIFVIVCCGKAIMYLNQSYEILALLSTIICVGLFFRFIGVIIVWIADLD